MAGMRKLEGLVAEVLGLDPGDRAEFLYKVEVGDAEEAFLRARAELPSPARCPRCGCERISRRGARRARQAALVVRRLPAQLHARHRGDRLPLAPAGGDVGGVREVLLRAADAARVRLQARREPQDGLVHAHEGLRGPGAGGDGVHHRPRRRRAGRRDTVNLLFTICANESAPIALTYFHRFRQRFSTVFGYSVPLLSRGRSFSR